MVIIPCIMSSHFILIIIIPLCLQNKNESEAASLTLVLFLALSNSVFADYFLACVIGILCCFIVCLFISSCCQRMNWKWFCCIFIVCYCLKLLTHAPQKEPVTWLTRSRDSASTSQDRKVTDRPWLKLMRAETETGRIKDIKFTPKITSITYS